MTAVWLALGWIVASLIFGFGYAVGSLMAAQVCGRIGPDLRIQGCEEAEDATRGGQR